MAAILLLPAIVALYFVVALIFAVPTMLLWDWLMPHLFNLREITLFQAWGLNLLCALLFKSTAASSKKDD